MLHFSSVRHRNQFTWNFLNIVHGNQSLEWISCWPHMNDPCTCHDDVIQWKHFPRYWPFVRGIPVTGEFPVQRPVTRSFGVFFDLRLNTRLSKQSWGWWFESLTPSLWCHWNDGQGSHKVIFKIFNVPFDLKSAVFGRESGFCRLG